MTPRAPRAARRPPPPAPGQRCFGIHRMGSHVQIGTQRHVLLALWQGDWHFRADRRQRARSIWCADLPEKYADFAVREFLFKTRNLASRKESCSKNLAASALQRGILRNLGRNPTSKCLHFSLTTTRDLAGRLEMTLHARAAACSHSGPESGVLFYSGITICQ